MEREGGGGGGGGGERGQGGERGGIHTLVFFKCQLRTTSWSWARHLQEHHVHSCGGCLHEAPHGVCQCRFLVPEYVGIYLWNGLDLSEKNGHHADLTHILGT